MLEHQMHLISNLNFLKERGMSNAELITLDTELPDNIQIEQTRTAALTIRCNNILLHSAYDPVKEAQRFIEAQNLQPGDRVLLCGFGLAYHVKEVLTRIGPQGKLIIFEPNFDVMNAALILVDFREIFAQHEVYLIAGRTEGHLAMRLSALLSRHFADVSEKKKKVVIHLPSYHCFPEHLISIKESFDLLLLERKASEVFGDLERENFIKNLDITLASPNIEKLRKVFHGKPAILISAGPSLDIVLGSLREYVDKAFIFTADTSYPFLQKAGITPDVVFSVDPQADTIKHFSYSEKDHALLIALPTMDTHSLHKYSGPKMCIIQKDNSITKKLEQHFENKAFTHAGGAVSCIALDVMFQLGCEPIIFAGMDYAFPLNKYYSTNTIEMKKWYRDVNRFNTIEMMHYEVIKNNKVRYVENNSGKRIPTHETLYLYLRQIEEIISRNPKRHVYNLMSQGSKIQGTDRINNIKKLDKILKRSLDKTTLTLRDEPVDQSVKDKIMEEVARV
ncbi:MAG: motility associated factor glycosyltransferase family protein [Candidatus Omnitrophica bacterium]|nr:motility associated factor glycosyltransferase family protein [Candidatus Omnitrophota bacterium]